MRLSHITLHGFKSFAKKTTLDVTHQVTGVVGPNGSGKSNVAEAIRFVLGEQSMKSMRGKLGSDLIFKGSNTLAPMSRATVTMVIDNKDHAHIDSTHASDSLAPYLVYDELTLSRTIYADGTSEYNLNDAKVRLKDVQELLSFAGIGASAHTIINQGEADRILLSSPKERKEALEDALGLRVYHMRLAESKRKLEKVKTHLHEVDILRKEIAPHLTHLKRQVEKLESKEKERQLLSQLMLVYLAREEKSLHEAEARIREAGASVSLGLVAQSIERELEAHANQSVQEVPRGYHEKQTLQAEIKAIALRRDELTKTLGRLEAEKAHLERELTKAETVREVRIPENTLNEVYEGMKTTLGSIRIALSQSHFEIVDKGLLTLGEQAANFFQQFSTSGTKEYKEKLSREIADFSNVITEHEIKAETLTKEMSVLEEKLQQVDTDTQDALLSRHEEEKKRLLLESKLRELQSTIALRKQEEGEVALRKNHFEALLAEGVVIVGREILAYKEHKGTDHHMTTPMHDLLRAIERSKLRIEEAGIPNAAEVIKEYKETTERDEYLTRELSDIKQSEEKLLMLIDELTKQLKERFVQGVLKVSENFTSFFSEIFDGGKAKLLLVDVIKLDEDGNELKEQGVDIEVKLPSKKIQELAMFSGGERALVSIALLFAMSSLTPPPFMVLDETDAPLDEHNARKYGSMLARLAEKSKLLVITHNRETMNHCDMLYGVTLGAEGTSKLLSIHFKDVAKTA